jgi:hypothetical protein
VVIKGNRIHNCGRIPSTNRHQGVSVWNATGTTVTENTIYDNADRGVQLFPNAQRTNVSYNTIDGNGEGILISGDSGFASSGNVVERNVITNSKIRDNVETFWPAGEPVGQNNVVRENCISGGIRDNGDGGVAKRLSGVVLSGNLYTDPDYVNRLGKDFRLRPGSPCLSTLSGTVWRAFSDQSLWNVPASQKGTPTTANPYLDEFGGPGQELEISGIPNGGGSGITYAKPIFFAKPGDPTTANVSLTTTWSPKDDLKWDGQPIPLPQGVTPAPGSDGHLTIVSADRRTAWDFWRATSVGPAGIVAAVITQWDLTGSGVAGAHFENSARGSGVPIIPSTVRADEALHGISHAIGITIPHVSSDYVYPPASHSDGSLGPDGPKYGQLFVLRADYQPPAGASIGERNIVQALKTYGAYLVDQGGSLELDADSNQPDVWADTGLGAFTLSISADDFRLIQ